MTVELDGTLLAKRQTEWEHWLANPDRNPLSTGADFVGSEVRLENELCVYVQDSRYSDGLIASGLIVTKRPCQTVFDLTPAEIAATHALLAEVRAHLDFTVQPGGYTVGWNVFPAGGAHIPHVHLHVIPRWNRDLAAGAGVRYFLKAAAQASEGQPVGICPAGPDDLNTVKALVESLSLGASSLTFEGCTFWLATRNAQAVGCIGLEHGDGASLLRSACVHPDWQGQGVGGRLAQAALGAARGRGDRAVYLFSSHAGGYWARLGFVQVPTAELSAALPGTPQVRSGECRGWIQGELAWKLDFSG
ncbi:GNAT family N-acetyltransferase [Deinococcus radiomollis]|uniref:GNAT family N-acetyltransferase n=1 Tax=Deinococcus radiomollis TaxID=468916 RepID=UPI003891E477